MICKVELNPKVTVEREPVQGGFKIYIIKKEIDVMKKTKKNNKGFSLVELIVVVLIMAIIAVALAPQVMKWVGRSRVSNDISVYEQVYSNLQTSVADEKVWNEVKDKTIVVTVDKNGVNGITADSELDKEFKAVSGDVSQLKFSTVTSATITITNGTVTKNSKIDPETGTVKVAGAEAEAGAEESPAPTPGA